MSVDISDAVALLLILFGGRWALPCGGSSISEGGNRLLADANGDGTPNISDAVYLLTFLFQSGPRPALGTRCVRIEGCPSVCPR